MLFIEDESIAASAAPTEEEVLWERLQSRCFRYSAVRSRL